MPKIRSILSRKLALFLFLASSPLLSFERVEDASGLQILNPDFRDRKTSKIRLENGLEMLLISDPKADQSGACVAVEAGSWNDPEEYPGMAHFCEHMLFMGTEKYPDENAFFSEIANFSGTTNAYTAPHRTVYMFSCQSEGFLSLLDRFGHFFIDPLFNPSHIAREMHAVDQEFAKSLENDFWRSYMVWKETGNQEHPNRLFSCGNSETLSKIPETALQRWHAKHYSGQQMHVVLYSPLPLKDLEEQAISLFSAVPSGKKTSIGTVLPLTSERQRGSILYIEPIQNRNILTLSWELPPSLAAESGHTADLLAYALNRGQKKSLSEKLKAEHLVDRVSAEVEEAGGLDRRLFQISFSLTEKGLQSIDAVALAAFQALASFQKEGIPSYFLEEKNKMALLNYQYQSRIDPFTYLRKVGETLPNEPLETYPKEQLFSSGLSQQNIEALLSLLRPETAAVTLLAPIEDPSLSLQKEKWMGAAYALKPIPSAWLSAWQNAEAHPEIAIAEPNPFLPQNAAILPAELHSETPMLLSKATLGTAYYARCPEYPVPEAVLQLHILSPQLRAEPKQVVLASLYLDHLTDLLGPTLNAASDAALHSSFGLERNRLFVKVSGFSEKAPLLLQEILRQMPLSPPTRDQFQLYVERHRKSYQNASKELAYKQGKELLDALLSSDKTLSKDKLQALETLRYEEFLVFHKKLLQTTYIEALFSGNLSVRDAENVWLDVIHVLGKTPFAPSLHPETKVLFLPAGKGPYAMTEVLPVQGNATLLTLDAGPFSFERRAAQEVLQTALKEAFFSTLRTKQKTGYIAASQGFELEGRLFHLFFVQSNSHQPDDLLFRFELFLEEYLEAFEENISKERFATLKKSLAEWHKKRFRNLQEKSALWNLLAFEKGADFAYMDKRIEALEALDYDALKKLAREFLGRANRKRLALLLEGKLPAPFVYEPLTLDQFQQVAEYKTEKPGETTPL